MLSGYLGLILGLVALIVVALALPHLRRRLANRGGVDRTDLPFRIVKRIAVGPRQGIGLLQVGDRLLVVSLADGGARLLTELTEQDEPRLIEEDEVEPTSGGHARPIEPVAEQFALSTVLERRRFPAFVAEALFEPRMAPPVATRRPETSILQLARRMAWVSVFLLAVVSKAGATTPADSVAVKEVVVSGLDWNHLPPATLPDQADSNQLVAVAGVSTTASAAAVAAPAPPAPPTSRVVSTAPVTTLSVPSFHFDTHSGPNDPLKLNGPVGLVVMIGAMTLIPAMLLLMTSFTRILIVLQFLRPAIGTQSAPPVQLLVALALLLTGVVMNPVLQTANREALQPLMAGEIDQSEAWKRGIVPFRGFMLNNLNPRDLENFVELTHSDTPMRSPEDVPLMTLAAAFVTSELKTSFQMGFLIFVPFVVVDLMVSSVLMSLGMFMLPPLMVSLPLKLLLFVLADGWTLVVRNLVLSFR